MLYASWDRSLVTQTEYRSEPLVDTSDHTPVCASFQLRVMLPADDDDAGDRHEWELTVASLEVEVPMAAIDDDEGAVGRMQHGQAAKPELMVEFYGA